MEKYVITIGREFGSGGRELGRRLSLKLGIPFYDKELLLQAAQQSGIGTEFFENNDERVPKFINGMIPFNFGVNPMIWYSGPSSISDDNLYRTQSDFMHDIADKGSCIIVGRTADYVLRDMPNLINVFIHADIEDCIDRIIERSESPDRAKARKLAERTNKLRANFYNFYTDKKWGAASSYDMTFNSSKLSLDEIVEIIAAYVTKRMG